MHAGKTLFAQVMSYPTLHTFARIVTRCGVHSTHRPPAPVQPRGLPGDPLHAMAQVPSVMPSEQVQPYEAPTTYESDTPPQASAAQPPLFAI